MTSSETETDSKPNFLLITIVNDVIRIRWCRLVCIVEYSLASKWRLYTIVKRE